MSDVQQKATPNGTAHGRWHLAQSKAHQAHATRRRQRKGTSQLNTSQSKGTTAWISSFAALLSRWPPRWAIRQNFLSIPEALRGGQKVWQMHHDAGRAAAEVELLGVCWREASQHTRRADAITKQSGLMGNHPVCIKQRIGHHWAKKKGAHPA